MLMHAHGRYDVRSGLAVGDVGLYGTYGFDIPFRDIEYA